jgi:hypothetical protein
MRKITLCMAALAMMYGVVSCTEKSPVELENEDAPAVPFGSFRVASGEGRSCASMEVLAAELKDNPSLARKMQENEDQLKRFAARATASAPYNGTVNIPVVVNVIYNRNKPQENISQAQIDSQIAVLNSDFSATNNDRNLIPSAFSNLVSNMDIRFTLAKVVRKSSTKTQWGTGSAMKKSGQGGISPTTPTQNLNIWVCNIGGGILGFATFPGGNINIDGVVISPQYFGTTGYVSAPFNKGRTATHEVGHWLNLRHIWGDDGTGCTGSDQVADTPNAAGPNYGCPTFPKLSCSNGPTGDLFMNYMDYTDDACMYMFTPGQTQRARALFATDGVRKSFVQ